MADLNYKNRKYTIVPYNPKWKDEFLRETEILKSIFSEIKITIEHIGSTAIPELAGKPTIDILILVENILFVDGLKKEMEKAGYKSLGEYVVKGAVLFVKEENNTRTMNIHIFQKDDPQVKEMLNFKNYFLNHPEIVKEYSELKFELFEKYPNDYGSYRKYKDEWMERLKEKIENK